MDELDERLLTLIEQNARQSSKQIAGQLQVSSATIRRRLKRLIDTNELYVEAYRDPIKTGLNVSALIGLNVDHDLHQEVMQKLNKLPEIRWVATTTGQFDSFVFVNCHSNEDLYVFLRDVLLKIPGIRDSQTFMCLHIEKKSRLR